MVHAMAEAQGCRSNGEMFLCHIRLSGYAATKGFRIAAVIGDVTEQVCDKRELGLRQLVSKSRVTLRMVGAAEENVVA